MAWTFDKYGPADTAWVDVADPDNPPAGAREVDADFLNRTEDALEKAAADSVTYATNDSLAGVQSELSKVRAFVAQPTAPQVGENEWTGTPYASASTKTVRTPSGELEVRRNLVLNPAAGGGTTAGWSAIRTTIEATDGLIDGLTANFFRVTVNGLTAGNLAQRVNASLHVPVTAGQTYVLSAWMRVQGGPREAQAVFYFFDASGAQVGPTQTAPVVASSAWQRVSTTGTAPAGAVSVLIRIGLPNQNSWAVGEFFDFGAVLFEDSATLAPYFDGDTDDSWAATQLWIDTANGNKIKFYNVATEAWEPTT